MPGSAISSVSQGPYWCLQLATGKTENTVLKPRTSLHILTFVCKHALGMPRCGNDVLRHIAMNAAVRAVYTPKIYTHYSPLSLNLELEKTLMNNFKVF